MYSKENIIMVQEELGLFPNMKLFLQHQDLNSDWEVLNLLFCGLKVLRFDWKLIESMPC